MMNFLLNQSELSNHTINSDSIQYLRVVKINRDIDLVKHKLKPQTDTKSSSQARYILWGSNIQNKPHVASVWSYYGIKSLQANFSGLDLKYGNNNIILIFMIFRILIYSLDFFFISSCTQFKTQLKGNWYFGE